MALFQCSERHAPADAHHRMFGWPVRDLRCGVDDCRNHAVVWLDPEELHDYELGARVFWEHGSLAWARLDGRPLAAPGGASVRSVRTAPRPPGRH